MPRKVVKRRKKQTITKPLKQDIKQTVKVVIGGDIVKKTKRRGTTTKKGKAELKPEEATRGQTNALFAQPYARFIVSNPQPAQQAPAISSLEQDKIKKDLVGSIQGTLQTYLNNGILDRNLNSKPREDLEQKLLEDKRSPQKLLDYKSVEINDITAEVEQQEQLVEDLQELIKTLKDEKEKKEAEEQLKEEQKKLKNKLRAQKAAETRARNKLKKQEMEAVEQLKQQEIEEMKIAPISRETQTEQIQTAPVIPPPSKIPTPVRPPPSAPKQKVKAVLEDDDDERPLAPKKTLQQKVAEKKERGFKGDLENKAFQAMLEEQGGMFRYGGRVLKKNKIFN